MKRFHRTTLITLIAIAASAAAARAQDAPGTPPPPRHGHPMGAGRQGMAPMRAMGDRLGLTDEQRKRIEDIRFNHRKKAITIRAEVESARLELGRLLHADAPDSRAIDNQIDRLAQLRAGLAKDRVAGMLEMRTVLTPEQRKEWREMRRGMRGWGLHEPGMEGSGGMPGGMGDEDMMIGPGDTL
jgi:Spy/CpxP family protein refolding chaperone